MGWGGAGMGGHRTRQLCSSIFTFQACHSQALQLVVSELMSTMAHPRKKSGAFGEQSGWETQELLGGAVSLFLSFLSAECLFLFRHRGLSPGKFSYISHLFLLGVYLFMTGSPSIA